MPPRTAQPGVAPRQFHDGHVHNAPITPRFHHRNFYVAPYYGYYYPDWPVWPGWAYPFAYDYYYQSEPYSSGGTAPQPSLPTDDMLAEGLPEGALEPNGSIDGFLYFQHVPGSDVQFEMKLTDANTGQQFGNITTPITLSP